RRRSTPCSRPRSTPSAPACAGARRCPVPRKATWWRSWGPASAACRRWWRHGRRAPGSCSSPGSARTTRCAWRWRAGSARTRRSTCCARWRGRATGPRRCTAWWCRVRTRRGSHRREQDEPAIEQRRVAVHVEALDHRAVPEEQQQVLGRPADRDVALRVLAPHVHAALLTRLQLDEPLAVAVGAVEVVTLAGRGYLRRAAQAAREQLEELVDTVTRQLGVDRAGCDVGAMNRRLDRHPPLPEASGAIARERPHRLVGPERREHGLELPRARLELLDERRVGAIDELLRRPVVAPLLGRRAHELGHAPVEVGEVGEKIGDGPAGAVGHL